MIPVFVPVDAPPVVCPFFLLRLSKMFADPSPAPNSPICPTSVLRRAYSMATPTSFAAPPIATLAPLAPLLFSHHHYDHYPHDHYPHDHYDHYPHGHYARGHGDAAPAHSSQSRSRTPRAADFHLKLKLALSYPSQSQSQTARVADVHPKPALAYPSPPSPPSPSHYDPKPILKNRGRPPPAFVVSYSHPMCTS